MPKTHARTREAPDPAHVGCSPCLTPSAPAPVHSQKDPYVDRIRYKDSNQEKKKGFYTSDFSKRDEFTNTIRTEQWREQLKVRAVSRTHQPAQIHRM